MTDTQDLSLGRRREGFSQGFPRQSFQMPVRGRGLDKPGAPPGESSPSTHEIQAKLHRLD